MTLPPLALPAIPLPFEIPSMIHPLFVHFAIVLPVVILLLELINLFAKKRTIGVLSFFLMVLVTAVFIAVYLTGTTDGKAAKAFLSPEAKEVLMGHKQLGIYLAYASGLLMLFKLFSVLIRKTAIKVLFFLVLIIFVIAVFNEGKKGGALVYQYGVNVKSIPAIGKVQQEVAPKKEEVKSEVKVAEPKVDTSKGEVSAPEIKIEEVKEKAASEMSVDKTNLAEGNVSH